MFPEFCANRNVYVIYDGIVLFADRTSGVLENIVWYDSLHVLRGSAARAQEVRELFAADVPTAKYVELSELEVVIAEMQKMN